VTSQTDTAPTIGLALGSGASRGWSHIGVINALLEAGIEPDIVCGASVGAMIGASYLSGQLPKLEEWVLGTTRTDVLKFFNIRFSRAGLVDDDRLSSFLHNYVAPDGLRTEDLSRRYAAVSTDLESGRETWLREGPLAEVVKASMAMPGLFPPVHRGNQWLVDGGLVNPVPVTTCRALGADVVIAVNLNSDIIGKRGNWRPESEPEPLPERAPDESRSVLQNIRDATLGYSNSFFASYFSKDDTPGIFLAVSNSINIFQDRITRSRLAGDPAEVVLTPRLAHIGTLEFQRAPEAIEEGRNCVSSALPDIRRLVKGI
jgi:NTE family protein